MLYLYACTARNRLRTQLARVRNPRYLVAVALGASYLYWALFRNTRSGAEPLTQLITSDALLVIASTLLLLSAARWWLFGADRGALAFTPPEVQFLFPAPVTRRGLVHTKLLRMQFTIFVNTMIFSVIFRGSASEAVTWERALGWWMLFSTVSMHRVGASIVRANAIEHGSAGQRRGVVPALVFASLFAAVVYGVAVQWDALRAATPNGVKASVLAVTTALQAPVPSIALWPVRVVLEPIMYAGSAEWPLALLLAALVVLGHYLWLVRLDRAFEEAALEATQFRAQNLQRFRTSQMGEARSRRGKLTGVPRLSLTGRPEVAIAWKNVAAALRGGSWRAQLVAFVIGLATLAVVTRTAGAGAADVFVGVTAGWGAMLLFVGPLWMRFDLRLDLPRLAILKTYPLAGWRIVTAQIAAVTILHSITVWSLMTVPAVMFLQDPSLVAETGATLPLLVSIVIGVPALNALMFTIHNGTALLFPGWVRLGTESRGFETMGQNLLTTGATAFVAAVGLVFPAGVAALVLWLANDWGGWSVLLATVLASLVVMAQLWPALLWLGTVFERTDVNDVASPL